MFPVKEEHPGGSSSSSSPRPIEGLHETLPPPFLSKTFDMVDDVRIDCIVSWSRGGCSFVVWDPHELSTSVLPNYFKHNNFSSFVRQLNTYGFRKIDPDKWEFSNESFLKGQKHLLKNIRRKKTPSQTLPSNQESDLCVEVGRFGLDGEIERLRRDKQVLVAELVKIRQQQQYSRAYLQQMELKLQCTEKKQQQMMSFLSRAVQNPEFINQLVQHKERRKEIEDSANKKRRRPIERGESSGTKHGVSSVKSEPLEFGMQVSELEALALEMQGFGRENNKDFEEEREEVRLVGYEKELDEGFWDEMFNEGTEEDVNFLADRFGFLGSSPK